jgi:L-threonylcarbamoyladenylate synthase
MIKVLGTTPSDIAQAVGLLRGGGVVALPTETVYGLAGDATNDQAVEAIFAAKGRPAHNPLIVHVASLAMARALGVFDPISLRLAERFWPGPLTLVLPIQPGAGISALATPGGQTIALRQPAHPIFQAVLAALDRPLAAPSANPSGMVSPTLVEHVMAGLGDVIPAVIDGGPAMVGVESTVVRVLADKAYLLRPGGISRADIEAVIGAALSSQLPPTAHLASPGQLKSHYAPRARLRLNATSISPGEALLAFGPDVPDGAALVANLSATGDLAEAARNLFAMMRLLDREGTAMIAVMPIPHTGIGEAINDRLARAAATRPDAI